uniref:Uncharacterized protein n=1 Tax=Zosterops lateralis melanops TaxID=1220523 RepID=A0A8D2PR01_ZOSLA
PETSPFPPRSVRVAGDGPGDPHPCDMGWGGWCWCDLGHRLEAGLAVCSLHRRQVQN